MGKMPDMESTPIVEGEVTARGRKVAIVAARFNDFIVSSLLKGATASWLEHEGAAENLLVARVPGAFELPVVARKLAASGRWDAVIALGCVIRGDTPHFEYVAGECARATHAPHPARPSVPRAKTNGFCTGGPPPTVPGWLPASDTPVPCHNRRP